VPPPAIFISIFHFSFPLTVNVDMDPYNIETQIDELISKNLIQTTITISLRELVPAGKGM